MQQNNIKAVSDNKNQERPLRLKAGIVIAFLTILLRFVIPSFVPQVAEIGVLGGMLGGLLIIVWWIFFSRFPVFERWAALIMMIATLIATYLFIHESLLTGMMGMMFPSYALPVLAAAFVVWAVLTRGLDAKYRWTLLIITNICFGAGWAFIRSDGITGHAVADFAWRWSKTAEERLLDEAAGESLDKVTIERTPESMPEWPGFRGPGRDGIVRGTRISTDWSESPPAELWRRAIGPGCASFAVHEDLLYTQEQRGEEEVVSCYRLSTGEPLWRHGDIARFWDSHAGAGPRSTPTLSGELVYSFGATGILNVLDAKEGYVIWSRNVAEEANIEVPEWGFTSSPLVTGDVVIVALAGTMIAYDLDSGEQRWKGKDGGKGYSSPHFFMIDGIPQVILMNDLGAVSVEPETGSLLWEYQWPHTDRILQPARTDEGEIILSTGGGNGMRRLRVSRGSGDWSVEELFSAVQMKSYFNDIVVHKDLAFGFTGPFVECWDIINGGRQWKGGRFGGQLILLADQDLLLVLSEKGELVLISATREDYTELGKISAIEGKTWNHPVLVGNILLVRNTEEMVAFQL